jgi:hypothetical protein
LIGVEPDAGAKGRLQEAGVGGCDAIPSQGVEVGGEVLGWIEAALGKPCPFFAGEDSGVQFALPEDAELLALRVVFDAGEFDERGPCALPNKASGGRGRSGRLLGGLK